MIEDDKIDGADTAEANDLRDETAAEAPEVAEHDALAQLKAELGRRYGVELLGPLGFENAYALAMKGDQARALGVASLSDLSAQAPRLTLGADLEFLSRPEWAAIRRAYGLSFKAERSYNPTFMYRALQSGQADVISAFSSDGRIAADRLTVLADPKGAIPAYDAIVLVSHDRHLTGLVCETFWRVADGRVEEFKGDLDDYAAWLRARGSNPAATGSAGSTDEAASGRRQGARKVA